MLGSTDVTAATSEQVTYMATLAQVLPVLVLAVALESRIVNWIGGPIAGTLVCLGILGEFFALIWLAGVAYSVDNPRVVDALPTFRFIAEGACFLVLALFQVFAVTALVRRRRQRTTM